MPPSNLHIHTARSQSPGGFPADSASLERNIQYIGKQSLHQIAQPGMKVTIAFTDATRYSPDKLLVGLILGELERAGIPDSSITLLAATGLHRPMTHAERIAKLGQEIVNRIEIIDHSAIDSTQLTDVGQIDSMPVVINRRCMEADLLIATGVVEPHQYAGYSGGSKTVVIGCGGEETIRRTHSAEMLDAPGTLLGAIDGNPFQQFVRRAGERVGLDYVINALLDEEGAIVAVAAGEPDAVHDHLVERARSFLVVEVEHPAHLAIAGVSSAKAVNLYQATRAATYLALAENTPLLPGAPIILPAEIPEGAGEGQGECRFFEFLSSATSLEALVEKLRSNGFPAGAQRAYIVATVLLQHPIIVAGALHPDVVRACHLLYAPNMANALQMAEEIARKEFDLPFPARLDLIDVPNAMITLPRLRNG